MRIPFLTGLVDRTRERTRILLARGKAPAPFPGPWTLRAVVRGDDPPVSPLRPPPGRPPGEHPGP
jgi:hypothetical protein